MKTNRFANIWKAALVAFATLYSRPCKSQINVVKKKAYQTNIKKLLEIFFNGVSLFPELMSVNYSFLLENQKGVLSFK